MSAPKQTAKPSSHDGIVFEPETKTSKPAEHFNLVSLLDVIKREYEFKPESEFDFKLFCHRVENLVAIPIQFIIKNGIKFSKSKNAKSAMKDVVIHYDTPQEILGDDYKIQLSLSKTKKIPPTCLNVFLTGNSKVEKGVDMTWIK